MEPNFWDVTYCGCHLKNLSQSKCKTSNTKKNSKAISMTNEQVDCYRCSSGKVLVMTSVAF